MTPLKFFAILAPVVLVASIGVIRRSPDYGSAAPDPVVARQFDADLTSLENRAARCTTDCSMILMELVPFGFRLGSHSIPLGRDYASLIARMNAVDRVARGRMGKS